MKIGICIGHSRRINGKRDGGAVSVGNVAEWDYNKDLANMVADRLDPKFGVVVVSVYEGSGYTAAQKWLAQHLKDLKVDVAAELHFNAADSLAAKGQEMLCWGNSTRGMMLAKAFELSLKRHVPEFSVRGVKSLGNSDRGAEFLKLTHCPAIICEPFFGSNVNDWRYAVEKKPQIADAYAEALTSWCEKH